METLEPILAFAKIVSPIGVIALLVIVILQLINGKGILERIRGPKLKNIETPQTDLLTLNAKLDKIANNHLHDLPSMKDSLERIEQELVKQGNRLTVVETTIKILLKQ